MYNVFMCNHFLLQQYQFVTCTTHKVLDVDVKHSTHNIFWLTYSIAYSTHNTFCSTKHAKVGVMLNLMDTVILVVCGQKMHPRLWVDI